MMISLILLASLLSTALAQRRPRPPPPPPPPRRPPPPPPPPKPVKPACGGSACDSDMLKVNIPNFGFHVPNLNQLPAAAWSSNRVNSGKMETVHEETKTTNFVKYGGFCAGAQKILAFKGASTPAGVANPSWIAKVPAGDLDALGEFKPGSYKIDFTQADLLTMNQAATSCQNTCKNTANCKYAHYGWEDGLWFCKIWTSAVCTDPANNWWGPAFPAFSVGFGAPPPAYNNFGGGCRVTDTIASNTPYLNPGVSSAVDPTTPFTSTLPYLDPAGYTSADSVVASIRCDVLDGGLSPGWPTYGTIWV